MSQKIGFFIASSLLIFSLIIPFLNTEAQIMQDLSCRSCVTIPPEEIELYKSLFPIIIWSEQSTYTLNSSFQVNGHIRPENAANPITVTVTNPIGNVVTVQQITPQSNGDFNINFNTASNLWQKEGQYIIRVQSGSESRSFSMGINLISLPKGDTNTCKPSELTVRADNTGVYCIPYKVSSSHITNVEGFLNTEEKILSLDIRGSNIGTITLEIPRYVLDAKSSSSQDSDFIVLFNDKPINFVEQKITRDGFRTLQIPYQPDRAGKIEIVGTTAIPEFGTIAILVLLVSISTILILSKKQYTIFTKV